jgi:predicted transcriptional regulator YheO
MPRPSRPLSRQKKKSTDASGSGAGRRSRAVPDSTEAKLSLLDEFVPMLARAIGPLCEVVLHENRSRPPTIRAIGNGHISGRFVGDLMTKVFVDGKDVSDLKTPLFNYLSRLPDGRQHRVSLIPILDRGKVIAYVAVNFVVQDIVLAQQALSLLVNAEPREEAIEEAFLTPRDVIQKLVDERLHDQGRLAALLDKSERIELLRYLRDRGVFRMRGAVDDVASMLRVSRAAIYNYLRECRGGSES